MHLILFDGPCPLCNRAVYWIAKRDRKKRFFFSTLQGETAKRFSLPNVETVVLIEDFETEARLYCEGAALKRIFPFLRLLPTFFITLLYRQLVHHRHRLCRCSTDLSSLKERLLP